MRKFKVNDIIKDEIYEETYIILKVDKLWYKTFNLTTKRLEDIGVDSTLIDNSFLVSKSPYEVKLAKILFME